MFTSNKQCRCAKYFSMIPGETAKESTGRSSASVLEWRFVYCAL